MKAIILSFILAAASFVLEYEYIVKDELLLADEAGRINLVSLFSKAVDW